MSRHTHDHGHLPYIDPDDDRPHDHPHEPPDNYRYPDPSIYGDYASADPPVYIPHPFHQACFRPRREDYKPPVTCNGDGEDDGLCHRKDSRMLTTDEQTRFINAYNQVNAIGALGPLVDIHANAVHRMHGDPRFLPWHRVYLVKMEELLMSVDPTVCIPYWKSSEEQAFPPWLLGVTPTVSLLNGPHTVNRSIGSIIPTLPDAAAVAGAMANGTYEPFRGALEGVHNSGHVWVGGSMLAFATAPADPIFWMHHAEIDRIWSVWQVANPGQDPPLAGSDAVMDPWPDTEPDTRDTTAMGYIYV